MYCRIIQVTEAIQAFAVVRVLFVWDGDGPVREHGLKCFVEIKKERPAPPPIKGKGSNRSF